MRNIRSNIWKLYTCSILSEGYFFIPILVPFLTNLGFDYQQIYYLEASFALVLILMEIPSGFLADHYGRKFSLVLGAAFGFLGMTLYAISTKFFGFLTGEILLGIGVSFFSGANEAMSYETLLELKEEDKYKKFQGNMLFYARIGAVVANISGGFLAAIYLRLPFYLTLIPFGAWAIITTTLVEPKRKKIKVEKMEHFKMIIKENFIQNKKLRWFMIYTGIITGFMLIAFWINQAYLQLIKLPIAYFGLINAAVSLTSGIGSKFAKEIEKTVTPKLYLILLPIIPALSWVIMSSTKSYLVLILLVLIGVIWGSCLPIFQDFIQKLTTSDRRATVLSIMSMLRRVVFFIVGPFIGWIMDVFTIQTALLHMSIIILLLSTITLFSLKRIRVL